MLDMILLVARRNVASTQCLPTFSTYKVQAAEVVSLAERLLFAIGAINGKELGCDDFSTIHAFEALKVKHGS